MRAVRMHRYNEPLEVEDVQQPTKKPVGDRVMIRVGAAGVCRTDVQMIDGYFREYVDLKLPVTPGHEIAGWVEEIGSTVPEGIIEKGDLVVVFGPWGCGVCQYCKRGDEQICPYGTWAGFGSEGGYSEYVTVPSYRFLIKVDKKYNLKPQDLAALADAGLTPYRAIKKARNLLGPGNTIAIIGIGGLGSYAVQYAKILSAKSIVLAFDRREEKLDIARQEGADQAIRTTGKEIDEIRNEINQATGRREVDVVINVAGTEESIELGASLLAIGGMMVCSGLIGTQIKTPLFPLVGREHSIQGSFWGNYNELREVIELAKKGLIRHHIEKFRLSEANDAINRLREGKVLGRAVLIPEKVQDAA
jgi:alcohol dehydrogenase, propanol-preferring